VTRKLLSWAGGCVSSTGSQEQMICPTQLMTTRKVDMYMDYPQEAYAGRTWTGVGSVHVMLIGFPV
jgi:hypothetical protein